MRRLLSTLGLVLALSGCASVAKWLEPPPPPLGPHLKGEALSATLKGNSIMTLEEQVPPLVVYFGANGDLYGMRSNNYRDSGTWTVKNDAVCGAWDNWYGTMSRCWEVFRSGDRLKLRRRDERDAGRLVSATLLPGDVNGLGR
jgi:hypothetical protein